MTESVGSEPLPEDNEFETVKRNFHFPFGRRVRPKRRIPRMSVIVLMYEK